MMDEDIRKIVAGIVGVIFTIATVSAVIAWEVAGPNVFGFAWSFSNVISEPFEDGIFDVDQMPTIEMHIPADAMKVNVP